VNITRRHFLAASSSTLLLAGCDINRFAPWVRPDAEPLTFGASPSGNVVDSVGHVLNRLSFGPRPADYERVRSMGIDAYIDEQLAPETIDDAECEWRVRRLEAIHVPAREMFEYKEDFLREQIEQATMLRAVYSRQQLKEVMTGFWTDHLNIALSKGDCPWLKPSDDRDVIRRHALGRFPELIRASALSPAMLWYLDGRDNRKASHDDQPNENYARELLELHTLGVHGGYTQRDVMEVARCLTGWTVKGDDVWFGRGRVEFRAEWHDDEQKEVLGHRIPAGGGERDIDDVLDIVCKHPATAHHIARKLAQKFVQIDPPEPAVRVTAEAFAKSEGDIATTLKTLFATEAFQQSGGQKFKRPFRFLVSSLRATAADINEGTAILDYAMRMGHVPFQYPTPDGYPESPEPWMGTLLWRWHFTDALARNAVPGTNVDWDALHSAAGEQRALAAHLLGRSVSQSEQQLMDRSGHGPAALLASPAFQRC
jgi:uncharacterized protein (DUF1800 family)